VTLNVTPAVADGSLSFSNGILRIGGTSAANSITVSRSRSNLVVSGSVSGQVPLAAVTEIRIWGRGGNDSIAVNLDVPTFVSGGRPPSPEAARATSYSAATAPTCSSARPATTC
jgi:hypothetical protein